jgi:TPP-dependent pyruvate/acetoin dehydrogenase alpha subunit
MNAKQLIRFERKVAKLFKGKKIRYPIHLSGGNEDLLINLFKDIKKEDYVFSTHRNHYHALLKGIPERQLLRNMLTDNEMGSMHTIDYKRHFFCSATVAGCVAIACGVALAIKMTRGRARVYVFCGDGCLDEGWFYEAWRYSVGQNLPIRFVVENNNRSVTTPIKDRWGDVDTWVENLKHLPKIVYYDYIPVYPHCGIGQFVDLDGGTYAR